MADSGILQIQLLGTTFSIRSDQDPEYIESITSYVKAKIDELKAGAGTNDPLRLSILVSMLITDELFRERKKPAGEAGDIQASEEASRLTAEIIERLEQSLQE